MIEPIPVYLFRHKSSGPKNEHGSVTCAAPTDLVTAVYGGGGHHDEDGVNRAFGHLFYRSEEDGRTFTAVWGKRYASRFRTALRRIRTALRRRSPVVVIREPPPARLVSSQTLEQRPPTSKQYGIDGSGAEEAGAPPA